MSPRMGSLGQGGLTMLLNKKLVKISVLILALLLFLGLNLSVLFQ